jgi:hypothetical protein
MKQVVKLGKMLVKLDSYTYECIEFKKFDSQQQYEAWRASKSSPPPAKPQG